LELKKLGRPIPSNDVWIAALCRRHKLPVMSRDTHFDYVEGLQSKLPVQPHAELNLTGGLRCRYFPKS
jgi:predicted nucleic acid-binding protein